MQGSYRTTPYNTAPVVVGETYRASVNVRSFWAGIYFYVGIQWYTAGGAIIDTDSSIDINQPFGLPLGTTEWVNGTWEAVAPALAAFAAVQVVLVENDGAHPHYIDAVSLRHVGP
jgi:hypothetical protein